jgi:uncharacterized protein (TIGR02246 family)
MATITARSPHELADLFMRLYSADDIDTLVTCYEDDAVFVPAPGQEARGRTQIAAALQGMRSAGFTIELAPAKLLEAGDTAVLSNMATVRGPGVDVTAPTIEVVRRQADGNWRWIADDPGFLSFLDDAAA